eukprot:scaffold10764_cov159-Ochromonas_danica.AAC.19
MLLSVSSLRTRARNVIPWRSSLRSFSSIGPDSEDVLFSGLNGAQDISVKVISCKHLVQDIIKSGEVAFQPATALGELLTCTLLMAASTLKGEETLQINLVGNNGVKNLIAIADSKLQIKGKVGRPRFAVAENGEAQLPVTTLFGDERQLQVIRSHPLWKTPSTGVVALRDTSITMNLALYLAESEQRSAVLHTEVGVSTSGQCDYALGVLVEKLPGASEENLEKAIANLQALQQRTLRSYLDTSSEPLAKILDDIFLSMEGESLTWTVAPRFVCSCNIDRVWRALRLLPKSEIDDIIKEDKGVEMKCEFCGKMYNLSGPEILTGLK